MSLKYRIESLDSLDEYAKKFYIEKNGSYVLDVEGAEGEDAIKPLRDSVRKERDRAEKLQHELDKLGGRKADEILTILDEYEAAKAGGKFDVKNLPEAEKEALVKDLLAVREKRFERERAELAQQLEAERKARGEIEGKYIARDRESFLHKALTGKVVPEMIEDAVALLSGRLQYSAEDQKFYAEDGTLAEKFVQAEIDRRKHWQPASKGGGAKGGAGGGHDDGKPATIQDIVTEAYNQK